MNEVTAAEALERLKSGNARYRSDKVGGSTTTSVHRNLSAGQAPVACVVTCSDSRVSPELIFDQSPGDLFVIRVAGHVCDDAALGSIEYAALHLGVRLVVVMGHHNCGAVEAAVQNADFDGPSTHSHIDALIQAIRPAVLHAAGAGGSGDLGGSGDSGDAGDLLDASIRQHARMVATQIRDSQPVLADIAAKDLRVIPAYYDLRSGEAEVLD
ncbi:carbonic anhydrase [bacterium]|nr:MAG: carbonic anhydrase [bacterium]RKZ13175.1 MAG: carbonic anhydrase [bacterium]